MHKYVLRLKSTKRMLKLMLMTQFNQVWGVIKLSNLDISKIFLTKLSTLTHQTPLLEMIVFKAAESPSASKDLESLILSKKLEKKWFNVPQRPLYRRECLSIVLKMKVLRMKFMSLKVRDKELKKLFNRKTLKISH